jgi:hypothetical protein
LPPARRPVEEAIRDPSRVELLVHERGIDLPDLHALYKDRRHHDPSDLDAARRLAEDGGRVRLGIFYRNESRPRYQETRHVQPHSVEDRLRFLNREFDRHAV